jgi:hypothetical protein
MPLAAADDAADLTGENLAGRAQQRESFRAGEPARSDFDKSFGLHIHQLPDDPQI